MNPIIIWRDSLTSVRYQVALVFLNERHALTSRYDMCAPAYEKPPLGLRIHALLNLRLKSKLKAG